MADAPSKCNVSGLQDSDADNQIREFVNEKCGPLLAGAKTIKRNAIVAAEILAKAALNYQSFSESDTQSIDSKIRNAFNQEISKTQGAQDLSLSSGQNIQDKIQSIADRLSTTEDNPQESLEDEKRKAEEILDISPSLQIEALIKAINSLEESERQNPKLSDSLTQLNIALASLKEAEAKSKNIVDFFDELQKLTDELQGTLESRGATTLVDQAKLLFGSDETKRKIEEDARATLERVNKIDENAASAISATGIPPEFKEECLLLSEIFKLTKFKKEQKDLRLPYVEQQIAGSTSCDPASDGGVEFTRTLKSNSPIILDGEPFGFINDLTQAEHFSNLFNLTTSQISSLVPTIRLFKVVTDPKTGKDIDHVEIEFDTNPSVRKFASSSNKWNNSSLTLFKSKRKRGVGIGLKNFDFTFRGSDPFSIKKDITANLSIFATSFGDLIQERIGTGINTGVSKRYSFADLALKTGKTPDSFKKGKSVEELSAIDKLNFRLKAVVGWAIPDTYLPSFSDDDRSAINDAFVVLNLTPVNHNFNFNEQGGVEFKIDYFAYITDYFNNEIFNVFSNPEVEKNRIGRQILYKFLQVINCDRDELEKIKEVDAQIIAKEKSVSFQTIISQLKISNKIYFYNLKIDQIKQFVFTGKLPETVQPATVPELNVDALTSHYSTVLANNPDLTEEQKKNLKLSLRTQAFSTGNFAFFFLSDLIDSIMGSIDDSLLSLTHSIEESNLFVNYIENLKESGFEFPAELEADFNSYLSKAEEINSDSKSFNQWIRFVKQKIFSLKAAKKQFEKMRIVLGPLQIVDPFNEGEKDYCSIGDIPISLNYFVDFLTSKMISRDQVYYPINSFIKDLVNDLLNNFLSNDSCFDFNTKQRVRIHSSTITAFSNPENDENIDDLTNLCLESSNKRANIKNSSKKPVLNVAGPSRLPVVITQNSREYNYFVFYAGRSYPLDAMKGDEQEDNKRGIFHYILGKDRGLVQTIKLDKTDSTGLKELRFEKEGYDGLTQLREVYNANITCFLNPNVYPGTYIYIDPKGFIPEFEVPEAFTKFGIGGYYMVVSCENSLTAGNAETRIVAKWVADTSGRARDDDNDSGNDQASSQPVKCIQKYRNLEASPSATPTTEPVEVKEGLADVGR